MDQHDRLGREDAAQEPLGLPIPDFCRGRALLPLAFVMQMVAIVLTLARSAGEADVLARLLLLSLYLHWIGLCSAAALCGAQRWLKRARPGVAFPLSWALLLVVTLVISDGAYRVLGRIGLESALPTETELEFVFRNVAISAIVSLLLLRYFRARDQWRSQVQAQAESRYQALHARIRPHFLFNTLNSLAQLIATKPAAAETMVVDLADLFRVSLDAGTRLAPLAAELELVRTYLRIEQTRLGARLGAEWDVPEHLMSVPVPVLSVQPLVENAVYHGIARVVGPATVAVRAREDGATIVIDVENPMPPDNGEAHRGTRLAVRNIAERLALIYGERAALELGSEGGIFRARLRLPRNQTDSNESRDR